MLRIGQGDVVHPQLSSLIERHLGSLWEVQRNYSSKRGCQSLLGWFFWIVRNYGFSFLSSRLIWSPVDTMEGSASVTSISARVFVGTAPVLAALDRGVSPEMVLKITSVQCV